MSGYLSPALEDYLEGILMIMEKGKVPRVKDLAKLLNVKASSVVEALKKLVSEDLILHEKYGYIELTQKGLEIAKETYEKHKLLKNFFIKLLNLKPDIAEKDACSIEHYLSKETINKIINFTQFTEIYPEISDKFISMFMSYTKDKNKKNSNFNESSNSIVKLSELKVNDKAEIVKIIATGSIKRRLLDMGFLTGEKIKIKKIAPMGSPFDIFVKNSHISLRKDEADYIIVRRI